MCLRLLDCPVTGAASMEIPKPAERPRCAWCDSTLRPDKIDARGFVHGWHYAGYPFSRNPEFPPIFCKLRCALAFAAAAYKCGVRRKTAWPAKH